MPPLAQQPQIYLITPPVFDPASFAQTLAACLDRVEVACLRLALATSQPDQIAKAADTLRDIAYARDVAVVIDSHIPLAKNLGLDGVHRTDGARMIATARKELGKDAIIGAHCHASAHVGMTAAEIGADYISFGPADATLLNEGEIARRDLFEWWSEMIEVPVVAEGGLSASKVAELSNVVDFFAIGAEIWDTEDPARALASLAGARQ